MASTFRLKGSGIKLTQAGLFRGFIIASVSYRADPRPFRETRNPLNKGPLWGHLLSQNNEQCGDLY